MNIINLDMDLSHPLPNDPNYLERLRARVEVARDKRDTANYQLLVAYRELFHSICQSTEALPQDINDKAKDVRKCIRSVDSWDESISQFIRELSEAKHVERADNKPPFVIDKDHVIYTGNLYADDGIDERIEKAIGL